MGEKEPFEMLPSITIFYGDHILGKFPIRNIVLPYPKYQVSIAAQVAKFLRSYYPKIKECHYMADGAAYYITLKNNGDMDAYDFGSVIPKMKPPNHIFKVTPEELQALEGSEEFVGHLEDLVEEENVEDIYDEDEVPDSGEEFDKPNPSGGTFVSPD